VNTYSTLHKAAAASQDFDLKNVMLTVDRLEFSKVVEAAQVIT
jgi:hypothetical protein